MLLMPSGTIPREIMATEITVGPLFHITLGEVPVADPHSVESPYSSEPGHKLDEDIERAKALDMNTPTAGIPPGNRDGIGFYMTIHREPLFIASEEEAECYGDDDGQSILAYEK